MPLERGTSRAVQSRNISELRHAGYPQKQAVAISYAQKRRSASRAKRGPRNAAPRVKSRGEHHSAAVQDALSRPSREDR